MKQILFVGLGGFIGSIARYLISKLNGVPNILTIPLGTFIVNIAGSLLIGLIAGLFAEKIVTNENLRLFLMVGVCGGFTTFSSFSNENFLLLQDGKILSALVYILGSLVLGVVAIWVGYRVAANFI